MEIPQAIRAAVADGDYQSALAQTITALGADSGSLHLMGEDGVLHLTAAQGIPESVLEIVRVVPVGKGMAGLAVERKQPVGACNIQTDRSGDVRPGARATGMEGAVVVPVLREDGAALGALGVANRAPRTFSEDETGLLLAIGRAIAVVR